MKKFLLKIYLKIKCPLVSHLFAFSIFWAIFCLGCYFYTQTSNYRTTEIKTKLIAANRSIVKECKGDYAISVLTIKANSPRRYNFGSVITYNYYLETEQEAKWLKDFYQESHAIDDVAYSLLKKAKSGAPITKSKDEWELSVSFKGAMAVLDVDIDYITAVPIKYKNTNNFRYIILILGIKDQTVCFKKDLDRILKRILTSNDVFFIDEEKKEVLNDRNT